jgi:hypothetical protein
MRGRSSGGGTSCPDDISITDGLLVLRRQQPDDLEMHLSAIDDDQIDWLWEPGDRARWEAMTVAEQRDHQARHLQELHTASVLDRSGPSASMARTPPTPSTSTAT